RVAVQAVPPEVVRFAHRAGIGSRSHVGHVDSPELDAEALDLAHTAGERDVPHELDDAPFFLAHRDPRLCFFVSSSGSSSVMLLTMHSSAAFAMRRSNSPGCARCRHAGLNQMHSLSEVFVLPYAAPRDHAWISQPGRS